MLNSRKFRNSLIKKVRSSGIRGFGDFSGSAFFCSENVYNRDSGFSTLEFGIWSNSGKTPVLRMFTGL